MPEPTIIAVEGLNGDITDDIASKVVTTSDSGFIISLWSNSTSGNIMNLCSSHNERRIFVKYDKSGSNIEWAKCINQPNDSAFSFMLPQANGDYVFGGIVNTPSPTGRDLIIYREDQSGNPVWGPKRYGGSAGERLIDMINTDDGGVIVLARSNSDDGDIPFHYGGVFNLDIWVFKIDQTGQIVWSNVFGGTGDDEPEEIIPLHSNNGYYIVGKTMSTDHDAVGNHGGYDLFVVKVDTGGNKLWSKCFGGSKTDGFYFDVCATHVGNGNMLIATGTSSDDGDVTGYLGGGSDIWLLAINNDGIVQWNKCYGTSSSAEYLSSVCQATDKSIWVGGTSYNIGEQVNESYGKEDVFVFRTDPSGIFLSSVVLGSDDREFIDILYPLSNGIVLAGGVYESSSGKHLPNKWLNGRDVFLAKIAPWPLTISKPEDILVDVTIHPNPTNGIINIVTPPCAGACQLQLSAIDGRVLHKELLGADTVHQRDFSTHANGVYIITIETELGRYTQKFIKQ